jgi:RNA polymerase sigma-70 factor (ECF subfamily)
VHRGPTLASAGSCPERTLWRSEIRALIRSAVDELPDDYRTVVVLRHFEEAAIPEIASQLSITPNAVKIRLHRARRRLHETLLRRGYPLPRRGPRDHATR